MNPLINSIHVESSQPDIAYEDKATPNPCNYDGIQHRPDDPRAPRVVRVRLVQENRKRIDEADQTQNDGVVNLVDYLKVIIIQHSLQSQVHRNQQYLTPGHQLGQNDE